MTGYCARLGDSGIPLGETGAPILRPSLTRSLVCRRSVRAVRRRTGAFQERRQREKFTQVVFELGLAMKDGCFRESKKCLPLG